LRFVRYGRTYQLLIESAADLQEVLALDESLWVATSAPVSVFRCDPQFLTLVDTDRDGRIHTDELKAAIRWLLEMLADRSRVSEGLDVLPLSAVRSDTPEGKAVVGSARYVLDALGAPREAISLSQVRQFTGNVRALPLNGDGVLVPEAAEEPDLRQFIEDVMASLGPTQDISGQPGVTAAQVERFLAAARRFLEWAGRGELPPGEERSPVMPLGPRTPQAFRLYEAHADKVESFFAQCRLLEFEADAAQRVGKREGALAELDVSDAQAVEEFLRSGPLAAPSAEGMLPLSEAAINPAYRGWIAALKEQVLGPVLGSVPEALSEDQWRQVGRFLAPYAGYLASKQGGEVEGVPLERLRSYCDGDHLERTQALVQADQKVADVMAGVGRVEQLLLYHQNLARLVNNFVSFPELYEEHERALFEMGSLVIDGRWFNLAVQVDDPAAHKQMAKQSSFFTMYVEVTGPDPAKAFQVAVPVTSGTRGNLDVGKRGVFFDLQGREYLARVVDILEQPISLREALVAPFVRVGRFLVGKIESLSATAQKQLEAGVAQAATPLVAPPPAAAPAPAVGMTAGQRAGMFVGISVALAAVSSAFAFVVKTLTGVQLYQIGLGVLGAALIVLVPVSIVALVKLRRRDLSALLEGAGWAINARMRLTRAQGRYFSLRKPYPRGAKGAPPPVWLRVLLTFVLIVVALAACAYAARELASYLQARRPAQEQPNGPAQPGESPAGPAGKTPAGP